MCYPAHCRGHCIDMVNLFQQSAQQALTPFADRLNAVDQQRLLNQQAQQKLLMEQQRQQAMINKQMSGGDLPATLQIANAYQQALEAGDRERAAQIAAFAKIYPKGFTMGDGGSLTPYQGYIEGERDISGAKSYGSTFGTQTAEKVGELASMQAKLPNLQLVVNNLKNLAEAATYTYGGRAADEVARQFGYTTPGAEARAKYLSTVRNQVLPLLRDTFGAAFTAAEGEKLEATLGDPNLSPLEKQAALDAFIAQKVMDIQSKEAEMQMRTEELPLNTFEGAKANFNNKKTGLDAAEKAELEQLRKEFGR